jgi:hypothetical protein
MMAVGTGAPDLTGALVPVRIAGEESSVCRDSQIVGLVHLVAVGQHGNGAGFRIDPQNIVIRIIRGKHDACAVEANAVGQAAVGKFDEYFAATFGRNSTDRGLALETHSVNVPIAVAGRTFDFPGETALGGERPGDEKFFGRK